MSSFKNELMILQLLHLPLDARGAREQVAAYNLARKLPLTHLSLVRTTTVRNSNLQRVCPTGSSIIALDRHKATSGDWEMRENLVARSTTQLD